MEKKNPHKSGDPWQSCSPSPPLARLPALIWRVSPVRQHLVKLLPENKKKQPTNSLCGDNAQVVLPYCCLHLSFWSWPDVMNNASSPLASFRRQYYLWQTPASHCPPRGQVGEVLHFLSLDKHDLFLETLSRNPPSWGSKFLFLNLSSFNSPSPLALGLC